MKNIKDIILDYEVKSFFYKETLELNIRGDHRGKFCKNETYILSVTGEKKKMKYINAQDRPAINITTVKFAHCRKENL